MGLSINMYVYLDNEAKTFTAGFHKMQCFEKGGGKADNPVLFIWKNQAERPALGQKNRYSVSTIPNSDVNFNYSITAHSLTHCTLAYPNNFSLSVN